MAKIFTLMGFIGGLVLTIAFLTNHYLPSRPFIGFLLIAYTLTTFLNLFDDNG